jgi:hypothetical protein
MHAVRTVHAGRRSYGAPGVYLEEHSAPAVGRGALRTGVPAFVGFAELRESDALGSLPFCHLDRWVSFSDALATPFESGYLAYAVRGFFENGGEHCIVVPVRYPAAGAVGLTEMLIRPFIQGGVLENVEEIDLVCVPDAMVGGIRSNVAAVCDIQSAALDHCQRMGDRFAVLDALPSRQGPVSRDTAAGRTGIPSAVLQWRALPSSHGGLYFPWLCVESHHAASTKSSRTIGNTDLRAEGRWIRPINVNKHTVRRVPPCGHVAGVYARTDARVGVHKAPANEVVAGALSLQVALSDDGQASLNDAGVNCLRSLPGRGIRVWGARSLSKQPNWRYVHVTRLFLTLTRWLKQNMNDFVFEPHGPQLWDRVGRRLNGYCRDLFDRGALMGRSGCNPSPAPATRRVAC